MYESECAPNYNNGDTLLLSLAGRETRTASTTSTELHTDLASIEHISSLDSRRVDLSIATLALLNNSYHYEVRLNSLDYITSTL